MLVHPFAPVYDENSEILILGTFPSVKSRENEFYYGHPQNRFWKMLAAVVKDKIPTSIDEKITFLHKHHIALWDVIASCEITGSADATITNATPNDIASLLKKAPIQKICCNGTKSWELFNKYFSPSKKHNEILQTTSQLVTIASASTQLQIPVVKLPSTSPANAVWRLEKLITTWECEINKK